MSDDIAELSAELSRLLGERDALKRSLEIAERFRFAVESAETAIMCVASSIGRYVFVNESFARLLGRSREEILASDPYHVWMEATHPEDADRDRDALARIAKGEIDSYRHEKRSISKSGGMRWVRVEGFGTRDAEGRLEYVTVYLTDIQEQRTAQATRERLEMQLQQAQKLGALGKLAGGVAHDFNNRLMVIMGYTELLKRGLGAQKELSAHADMVLTSAERAANLTRQLLAYSRRQVLKREAFGLNETIEHMRPLLDQLLGDQVQIVSLLHAKHPIFSDPSQIEQVILNLAINARDAMQQGGRLTLETSDVTFPADGDQSLPEGDYVMLTISDTGLGIPEQVLPHIFEPFFTTKAVGSGTGLGLSMVEGIVNQSGGSVRVQSQLGEGTTFTLYLPRARVFSMVSPRAVVEATPGNVNAFETVLVCDDDDEVRELLVNVLALGGYGILKASDGSHALEVARDYPDRIHILVTDLVMPRIGGIELASKLRKRDPKLRVLYLSGYIDNPATLADLLGPNTHLLPKPFLPGELMRTVHAILHVQSPGESLDELEPGIHSG